MKNNTFNHIIKYLILLIGLNVLLFQSVLAKSTAMELYKNKEYEKAFSAFDHIVQSTTADSTTRYEALYHMSKIALKIGKTQQAQKLIKKILDQNYNDAKHLLLAAEIYCERALEVSVFKALSFGRTCGKYYGLAVKNHPGNAQALSEAALFFSSAPSIVGGSSKKANAYLARLEKIAPEAAKITAIEIMDENGEEEQALVKALKYAQLSFNDSEQLYWLAHFLKDKQQFLVAERLFLKLQELKKTAINDDWQWYIDDSLFQIGDIYLEIGQNIKRSIEYLESYVQHNTDPYDKNFFWGRWSLAKAYHANNQVNEYQMMVAEIKKYPYQKSESFTEHFENGLKNRGSK